MTPTSLWQCDISCLKGQMRNNSKDCQFLVLQDRHVAPTTLRKAGRGAVQQLIGIQIPHRVVLQKLPQPFLVTDL